MADLRTLQRAMGEERNHPQADYAYEPGNEQQSCIEDPQRIDGQSAIGRQQEQSVGEREYQQQNNQGVVATISTADYG